jgi:hypothetical protein
MSRTITRIIPAKRTELLPNVYVRRPMPTLNLRHFDPFVFLDHFGPNAHEPHSPKGDGTGAHPHRGIITVTYLFDGEMEHFDSFGGHGVVRSGGVQWMVAGGGVVHDEGMTAEFAERGGITHGIQLWLTLPMSHKAEKPSYGLLQSSDLPIVQLSNDAGWLKVVAGEYWHEGTLFTSAMPLYSPLAIYHLHLHPNGVADISLHSGLQTALYLASEQMLVGDNEVLVREAELAIVSNEASDSTLLCQNIGNNALDALFLVGQPIGEPIVMNGPFVMNTREGIVQAYRDYEAGKYGVIRV